VTLFCNFRRVPIAVVSTSRTETVAGVTLFCNFRRVPIAVVSTSRTETVAEMTLFCKLGTDITRRSDKFSADMQNRPGL
jgi:hypothetical protein